MARLAWFSPMPPARTGIAIDSTELVAGLQLDHQIDVFVDEPLVGKSPNARSAHDFVWMHAQAPYDLTVYQLGNSSHHDYLWPYLLRYPGLAVLHDLHLHHARAAALLRTGRADQYRAEFAWNHPDVSPDLAELAVAGFDTHLYYAWPMTRLVVQASRLTAVHVSELAQRVAAGMPGARVEAVRLGHGIAVAEDRTWAARGGTCARLGIPADAILFGCFGGLGPDKRIPQILDAFVETLPYAPSARLLLCGAPASHYDLNADVAGRRLGDQIVVTGYIESDEELTDCVAACDATLNLRWPTAREVSGPWLRSLAAGKPTVIFDVAHLARVPSLDPRTWSVPPGVVMSLNGDAARDDECAPVCIAIDIVDEDHSLRLAMRRLACDPALREALGRAARQYWSREHRVEVMIQDYRRLIDRAMREEIPHPALPPHALDDGGHVLCDVIAQFGLPFPLR